MYTTPGSPPHTRERPIRRTHNVYNPGITPAYAGKTILRLWTDRLHQDHPRIRGKDVTKLSLLVASTGSPPHTRERPTISVFSPFLIRITPAYAGKTLLFFFVALFYEDHPRIRGKDFLMLLDRVPRLGSPPHTRERPFGTAVCYSKPRITPAYAGKTSTNTVSSCWNQDHPRIRGKDSRRNLNASRMTGSPPHTRERRRSRISLR